MERCLKSVPWADEVVVVDSASTDGTQEIARRLGAAVAQFVSASGRFSQEKKKLGTGGAAVAQ